MKLIIFVMSILIIILIGCSAPKSLSEQLILTFDPTQMNSAIGIPEKGFPYRVQIKDLELGRLYDNANVIIRSTDYSVQFSKKGAWAVRPNYPASELLKSVLKAELRCKSVRDRFSDKNPDYVISGSILTVEEDARKSPNSAHIEVLLSILRYNDEKTIFEKRYSKSTALPDTGYVVLAKAFSLSLKDIYGEFLSDAVSALNTELLADNAKDNSKNQ